MLSSISRSLKIGARYSALFLCLLMFLLIIDGVVEFENTPIVMTLLRCVIYFSVIITIPYLIKRKAEHVGEPLSDKARKKQKIVIAELLIVFVLIEVAIYFRGLSL